MLFVRCACPKLGPIWAQFRQSGSRSGRVWPSMGQCRPNLRKIGRSKSNSDQTGGGVNIALLGAGSHTPGTCPRSVWEFRGCARLFSPSLAGPRPKRRCMLVQEVHILVLELLLLDLAWIGQTQIGDTLPLVHRTSCPWVSHLMGSSPPKIPCECEYV